MMYKRIGSVFMGAKENPFDTASSKWLITPMYEKGFVIIFVVQSF